MQFILSFERAWQDVYNEYKDGRALIQNLKKRHLSFEQSINHVAVKGKDI
jgi:hypothetical protein